MNITGPCKILKIYLSEDSMYKKHNLYHAIVAKLKELDVAGVTVTRGIEGYGQGKRLSTIRLLPISDNLPIIIEAIDKEGSIGIISRSGRPLQRDLVISFITILFVIEASRRVIGPALGIIALAFSLYAFLGPHMPRFMAFKGVSLSKYVTQLVLSTEGIYGIPLDVSAQTVAPAKTTDRTNNKLNSLRTAITPYMRN